MTDTKKAVAAAKPRKKPTAKPAASKTATRKSETAAAPKKAASKKAPRETITIDGKSYPVDTLSENAKAQITNLRATDRMIEELEMEIAITKTARQRYGEALEHELKQTNTTLQ